MKSLLNSVTVTSLLLTGFLPHIAFAYHDGSTPPPEDIVPPDFSIIWIIAGIVIFSILLIFVISFLSSKMNK